MSWFASQEVPGVAVELSAVDCGDDNKEQIPQRKATKP